MKISDLASVLVQMETKTKEQMQMTMMETKSMKKKKKVQGYYHLNQDNLHLHATTHRHHRHPLWQQPQVQQNSIEQANRHRLAAVAVVMVWQMQLLIWCQAQVIILYPIQSSMHEVANTVDLKAKTLRFHR